MRRVSALVAMLLLASAFAAPAQAARSTTSHYEAGRYIVTFADEPVAGYAGTKAGYPATRPAAGKHINPRSAAVLKWQTYLKSKHDAALAKVGATKIYDYTVTNNAVAVRLSAKQASKLAAMKGVIGLSRDRLAQPDTSLSKTFLGLDAAGGLWSQLGGNTHAGAGIVVGVIDTGIWPESPSFAGGTGIPVPSDWHGTCVDGELFTKHDCNDKLIGARYFVAGFGKNAIATTDYLSPRDGDGHGSHTASTAAGNRVSGVKVDGKQFDDGIVSGMAPGAKVAAYKVCWEGKTTPAGCFNSDSVAAINAAVLDGVDVINYSIGGTSESDTLDVVEQAFRQASNAGVFVANSAGNSGPGASTLDHPSPWITTVAAATHRRAFQAVQLGNGARYVGASTTDSLPTPTTFVTSLSVKLASATDLNAELCAPGSLDPAKAAGKVVQCDRGVVDRIAKSAEVKRAGGVGMVMTNKTPNSLNGDFHFVPSVHVAYTARQPILDYIAAAGANATAKIVPLTAAELAVAPQVPEIADFSSRGPSTTTDGDILKPDIAAPGVDVLAAVAPPFHFGRSYDLISGTSMASPHIAGIGALLKALHPTWLPSEIKSAMMTSARDTVSSAGDPFAQGSGFVNPNAAADPGLVYPTTANEYRQYLVGLGVQFAAPFDTLTPVSASNLNQASIAIGKLAGVETVTRRVKNVDDVSATYAASVNLPGFDVAVTPSTVTLAPGAEATFQVTFTRTSATLNAWAAGSLTWTGGGHTVRTTIAVQPVAVSAPVEVHGDGASGSKEFQVTPGFTGSLVNTVHGLIGVTPINDSVATGGFDDAAPVVDADTKKYSVVVPAGTLAARFSLDAADNSADLDLWVYMGGEFVDLSASGAADEEVTLLNPAAGTYDVYVNGFSTPGGSTAYGLANFVVGSADLPNSDITPATASVTVGQKVTFAASWTGLDTTKRWLGVISYAGTTSAGAAVSSEVVTILSVN
jgi:subtilisin family serine protease